MVPRHLQHFNMVLNFCGMLTLNPRFVDVHWLQLSASGQKGVRVECGRSVGSHQRVGRNLSAEGRLSRASRRSFDEDFGDKIVFKQDRVIVGKLMGESVSLEGLVGRLIEGPFFDPARCPRFIAAAASRCLVKLMHVAHI